MSLPTIIKYKSTRVVVEDDLKDITDNKLSTLSKFISDDEGVTCEVEFEKVAARNNGRIFRVEVNLEVAGSLYRAEATEESFERAIDEVREELDKEMRRANRKKESLFRRGGRKIKEMMRFGGN